MPMWVCILVCMYVYGCWCVVMYVGVYVCMVFLDKFVFYVVCFRDICIYLCDCVYVCACMYFFHIYVGVCMYVGVYLSVCVSGLVGCV